MWSALSMVLVGYVCNRVVSHFASVALITMDNKKDLRLLVLYVKPYETVLMLIEFV